MRLILPFAGLNSTWLVTLRPRLNRTSCCSRQRSTQAVIRPRTYSSMFRSLRLKASAISKCGSNEAEIFQKRLRIGQSFALNLKSERLILNLLYSIIDRVARFICLVQEFSVNTTSDRCFHLSRGSHFARELPCWTAYLRKCDTQLLCYRHLATTRRQRLVEPR